MRITLAALLLLATGTTAAAQKDKDPGIPDGLKALKNEDPSVRYKAAHLLYNLGPIAKFAAPALREALQDKDVRVRVKVAEALWRIEKTPARTLLPALLDGLKEKDPLIRINSLVVMGRMGTAARPAIAEIGKRLEDKDFGVRMEAVLAMGEMGAAARPYVDALFEALRGDELRLMEPVVAVSLGNIGKGAVVPLTKALGSKDAQTRRTAAHALAVMGDKAAEAMPALEKALADKEADVRARAAKALGRIGEAAKATAAKLTAALKDGDAIVRVNAALALYLTDGSNAGAAVLTRALKDKEPFVREQACAALAEVGAKVSGAAAALRPVLNDTDTRVRALAAEALGKIAEKSDLKLIAKLLSDKDEDIRLGGARGLWPKGDAAARKAALEVVTEALKHESASLRKHAAVTLGEFGPDAKAAAEALTSALRDPDQQVRDAAAAALMRVAPDTAKKLGLQ